jgi:uncharacterized membrane protein YoaK (UPF0700 family)
MVWHVGGPTGRSSDGVVLVLIALSGLAMGVQAAAVRHLGVPGVASTYITGTLTSLMAELVSWLRPRGAPSSGEPGAAAGRHLRLLAAVFMVYGAGALVGAVLHTRSSTLLAWLPFVCVVAVVVTGSVRHGGLRSG